MRPNVGVQLPKPNLQTQSQILLASHQQQALAQSQAQNNIGSSNNFGDMDPRRFGGLPRSSGNAKDAQCTKNEGSICSPGQSSSPKVSSEWICEKQECKKAKSLNNHTCTTVRTDIIGVV